MNIEPGSTGPALTETEAATNRLVGTISGLGEDELRAPSLLPGWSRGHVITHIARNADSLHNLVSWARGGVEIPQYESMELRDREIAAGAGRSAAELADDVRTSADRLATAVRALPADALHATVRAFQGWPHPAWYTVFRRWREVEVHHADLGAGYSHADWPEPYLRWELTDTLGWLRARGGLGVVRIEITDLGINTDLWPATAGGTLPGPVALVVRGTGREVLGWLAGRTDGAALETEPAGGSDRVALPVPPVWPQAPAIDWNAVPA